jgi:hypothetical protein
MVVDVPEPGILPGLMVHVPVEGKPINNTLPVATAQVGWVMVPTVGADGVLFTVNVYVAIATEQGDPKGLSVVMVMSTVFPKSPTDGAYVKVNGVEFDVAAFIDPDPLCVMVTIVALINVFPLMDTGAVPQAFPLVLLKLIAGAFVHPHDTVKLFPVVVQPDAFRTVMI